MRRLKAYYCIGPDNRRRLVLATTKVHAGELLGCHPGVVTVAPMDLAAFAKVDPQTEVRPYSDVFQPFTRAATEEG